MEGKPLSALDIANDFKPKYREIPENWQKAGAQGFLNKQGNPFTILWFYDENNVKVGFFADKVVKTEAGIYAVEVSHFEQQTKRAALYGKK